QKKKGEHVLIDNSEAVSAKFARYVPVEPYTTLRDGELVTVTIKTAAATGTLNVLLRYTVVGY
ncbi:hypothetical protein HUSEC_28031, partial [Escherichia coli O104:H4 str. LB226692]